MKRLMTAAALLLALTATAQEKKMVRIGGGGDPEATKDWPKAVAKKGASDAEITAELGRYLNALSQKDVFSGVVVVTRDGKPLFQQAYGFANKEHAVPNTLDTKFNLGSINKTFTTVALMQLRDEGKLDFSKTLRTYLPDWPNAAADQVTIQQLMEHSSGFGDIFGPAYQALPKGKLRTLSDYVPLFIEKPLEFEPGSKRRYSNAGYVTLGLVIEKLSGMSYYDYVRTRIFAPLGMNDTESYEVDAHVPRRATGYTRRMGDTQRANVYSLPGRGSSAGGGYSTAGDLLRFVTGVKKVLTPQSFQKYLGDRPGVAWGGGAPGINAAIALEDRYAVIVLSNYDPPSAEEVAKNVRAVLGIPME